MLLSSDPSVTAASAKSAAPECEASPRPHRGEGVAGLDAAAAPLSSLQG